MSAVASQLVVVPKSDNTIRLCTNYTKVNKEIFFQQFPVANFDDTISRMAGKEYYALLDGVRTYNQFRLHTLSRYLTAFVCLYGLFEFVRCPFGIHNLPGWLHRVIREDIFVTKIRRT